MLASALSLLLSLTVTVTNPLDTPREAVPVIIPISNVKGEINSATIKGYPELPYQLDDLDDDGRPDELVFLLDLKPNAKETISINLSDKPETRKFTAGTNAYIRLNDKNKKHPKINAIAFPGNADNRQMYNSIYGHGVVLEGLFNAIRIYMDNRQSVDLYAKNTPQLELDVTGFYTTPEQLKQGYGRDILWAGTSVALGSFRGYEDGTLLTIDSVTTRMQRVVTTGPIRSIVEVNDRGWVSAPGKAPVDMRQRYTMYAGHRDVEVDILIRGSKAGDTYCTGIQKLATDNVGFINADGLAGSWGKNIPDKNLPDIDETLGLGIYVAAPYLQSVVEDDLNYLTLLKADANGHIRYTFTSAALRDTTSPRTSEEWFSYLAKWKTDLMHPVKTTVKKK